jgi:hypothetical protein
VLLIFRDNLFSGKYGGCIFVKLKTLNDALFIHFVTTDVSDVLVL